MIGEFEGFPHSQYIDLRGPDGSELGQIVVYTPVPIDASSLGPGEGTLRFQGRPVVLIGRSKRPGSDSTVSELQFLADSWTSLML